MSVNPISLNAYGIKNARVRYQLSPDELHEITIAHGMGARPITGLEPLEIEMVV